MRSNLVRLIPALFAAALLMSVSGWLFADPTSNSVSQVSAIAAAPSPTPTFFSELGPAVVKPPRDARLPSSGAAAREAPAPWLKLAGLALALGGVVLVYTALRMRPQNDA